jgi:cytochrome c biogenesis factor
VTTIGEMSLWVALVMAAWGTTVSFLARSRGVRSLEASGERAIHAVLALVSVTCAALLGAMLAHDFSVAHVARFTSANLPRVYLFTAFWAGREASWLFAALLLASISFLAVVRNRLGGRRNPFFTGVVAAVLALTLGVVCLVLNPFEHLPWTPLEGQGLHPQLQSPGMVLHPPILYAGYVTTVIPFALALAAIIDRGMPRDVMASVRRWMLAAWMLNAAGIFLGLWWAYREPAFGTGWLRYAFQNGSLLPWAVSTVFLFVTALQERRGRMRNWLITLVVAAFLLSAGALILSIERIAAISIAATASPSIWIAVIIALGIAAGGYLVSSRVVDVPIISGTTRPDPTLRIGIALIAGAVAAIGVSFAGMSLSRVSDVILQPAQSLTMKDGFDRTWTITSQGTSQYDILNRRVTAIALNLGTPDGRQLLVSSELRQHLDARRARIFEPSREPGIRGGWLQDVYVVLNEVSEEGAASITVSFNPLIRWLWIGGALLVLGGLLVFAPRRAEG